MRDADATKPADVLAALSKLLEDPAFQASARNKQFLRFVVEEALAGRAERIKSYTIAVDVFGRPSSFDGSTDPIVRIEANRLRAALAKYYSNPAQHARIVISLPKGGYVPEFSHRPGVADAAREADKLPISDEAGSTTENHGAAAKRPPPIVRLIARIARSFRRKEAEAPILFVDRVEALVADARTVLLARTLEQSLVTLLGRHGIAVFREPPGYQQAVARLFDENRGRSIQRLSAEVWSDRDKVCFWWTLSDMRSMQIRLSASEDAIWRQSSDTTMEAEIAQKVVAAIAKRGSFSGDLATRIVAEGTPHDPAVA